MLRNVFRLLNPSGCKHSYCCQSVLVHDCCTFHLCNKTGSAFFVYCRFSLFLKDPLFHFYLEVATAVVVSV